MLEDKIKGKSARVGVIGIGFVGLPLAVCFKNSGYRVVGIDTDKQRVDSVNRNKSYITDVEDSQLSGIEATCDMSVIKDLDIVSVCVPTPMTKAKSPDLTYMIEATRSIARYLHKEMLIIPESTTYPGTTRSVVVPILEESGLKCGIDFYLAYSPEMIDPGNKTFDTNNTPKLIGGYTEMCAELACQFYRIVIREVYKVPSLEVAELAKIYSNIFRNVNIALVNEFAQLCHKMGISVWDVINAAAKKPFGFMPFYPGSGAGGPCLSKDPYYLAELARGMDFHVRFIELAADINENMPQYVVSQVQDALNKRGKPVRGASILVLGITYKKDVADTRDSPAIKIIEKLLAMGANVSYNDPYIKSVIISGNRMYSVRYTDAMHDADCVLIAVDHSHYDYSSLVSFAHLVYDTRNATKGLTGENIVKLGE